MAKTKICPFLWYWQIVPAVLEEMMRDKDPKRSKRASDAMLEMVKLDIATLEKAYRS
jgi:predicted 3-demethylubiquinone-9 3-methyltransferase (glyoxalase superfamily)